MSSDGSQRPSTTKNAVRLPAQRKLRSSCDACSASKIKCDQERPSCLRCRNMEVKCNYSASRRMGKPPAPRDENGMKSTKSKSSLTKKGPLDPLHLRRQHAGQDTLRHHNNLTSLDLDSYFMDSDDHITMQWQVDSFYSPGPSTRSPADVGMAPRSLFDHDLGLFNEAKPNGLASMTSTEDIFAFDDVCMDPLSSPKSNDTFSSHQTSTGQISKIQPQPAFHVHGCTTLASSTIQLLHLDSISCGAPTPLQGNLFQPISSIDQVLINNKSAIENAHSLLACPCSLNSQSALTIALIIHNILICYETIIRVTSTVGTESGITLWPDSLRATPITVGAYKIDAEDEQRMRIQLVVNELRKVRGLVDKYAERYCKNKEDEVCETGIYSALNIFLQAKLKQAVTDMASILRA